MKQQPRAADADEDVVTDPALDNGESADWSSEGGATPSGPATETEAESSDD